MSTVLVTGATGLIGSNVAAFLVEQGHQPLTEASPLDLAPSTDPYTVTKRQAFVDAMARVEQGQDIAIVISGGAFGPSPIPERTMVAPSFNLRAVAAITGELEAYVDFPIPWVYAADVAKAAISALTNGRPGERYLAFGRPEDVGSIPFFCNVACEVAGSARRVVAIGGDELDDPGAATQFGPSLIALAKKRFPQPFFVNDLTVSRLGYEPMDLRDALVETIAWLREHNLLHDTP